MPPIIVEGLEHDLDAGLAADEFVRAGADRMLCEAVVADLGDVVLRHDEADGGGRGAVERHKVGPDLLQMKADHPRIDDFDPLHLFLQHRRAGPLVPVEAEFDVLGRQRIAVVECQPRAQLELVGQAVLALLPGFGQRRTHLLSGIGAHERVVERVEDAERRDLRRRQRGIEPGRRNRHVKGDDDPPRRGRRRGERRRSTQHGRGGEQRADDGATRRLIVKQGHYFLPFQDLGWLTSRDLRPV